MSKSKLHEAAVPFCGFYDWVHDDVVSYIEAMYVCENMMSEKELEKFYEEYDIALIEHAYAEEYVKQVFDILDMNVVLKIIESPREYNFTTDRLFVDLTDAQIERMYMLADEEILDKVAAQMFESRSGFHSFYAPEWRTWGPPMMWDHNQLECLISSALQSEGGKRWESDMLEMDEIREAFEQAVEAELRRIFPDGLESQQEERAKYERDLSQNKELPL